MARSGHRAMSHSIKKIFRRNNGNVKCSKSKRKQLSRVEPKTKRSAKQGESNEAELHDGMEVEVSAGKSARADARRVLGKQLRQDQYAKRRGITPSALGGGNAGDVPEDDGPTGAMASAAAASALSNAAQNQRAYHKELSRVLKESDVLLEVLDARDPLGCRCEPLENAVLQRMTSKRIVLVLNKVDLVPRENAQRWLTYLRQYFPTLPFKSSTQSQRSELSRSTGKGAAGADGGAESFGGEQLLQLLKNYSRSLNMKTAITVGIVGYPNVGKSSLINSLKRARAVNVGATPGVTSSAQVVALDKKVKLMDCPGIVFARAKTAEEAADVMLRNCVKVEKIDDLMVPIGGILRRCEAAQLQGQYGIGDFQDATQFLTLVAMKRGQLRKGGAADQEAAARVVMQDWNSGVIKYWSEPPQQSAAVSIVGQLGDEFDWSAAPKIDEADELAHAEAEKPSTQLITAQPSDGAQAFDMISVAKAELFQKKAADPDTALVTSLQRQQELGFSKRKNPRPVPRKMQNLTDEHDKYNFQHNRAIKKQQRSDRRKKRRAVARTLESLTGLA